MKGLTETEQKPGSAPAPAEDDGPGNAIFVLRLLQILSLAAAIVGFIWSSGDFLTSLFPENSVVTPTSVLLMLYGSVGTLGLEGIIRFLTRKKAA